jgi:hypothetical protein
MGVFQNIKTLFLVTFFLLLCCFLWLAFKVVTKPEDMITVAAAQLPTPDQEMQIAQRQPMTPGQEAMRKSMDRVFTDVSHQLDEAAAAQKSVRSNYATANYAAATDDDYSDFGKPSVDVSHR